MSTRSNILCATNISKYCVFDNVFLWGLNIILFYLVCGQNLGNFHSLRIRFYDVIMNGIVVAQVQSIASATFLTCWLLAMAWGKCFKYEGTVTQKCQYISVTWAAYWWLLKLQHLPWPAVNTIKLHNKVLLCTWLIVRPNFLIIFLVTFSQVVYFIML